MRAFRVAGEPNEAALSGTDNGEASVSEGKQPSVAADEEEIRVAPDNFDLVLTTTQEEIKEQSNTANQINTKSRFLLVFDFWLDASIAKDPLSI